MILGVAWSLPAPEPPWFSPLGLRSVRTGSSAAHLGASDGASHHVEGSLTVVADAARTPTEARSYASRVADAYLRFGASSSSSWVRDLPGRFRFLLHDADTRVLFAASSTAPFWPLAYWSDSRTTIVSSRLLPMLRCPDVPRTLDEAYLVHLVTGLASMSGGSTALRCVRRLCPG
jgi:asparagine synthetase B (glutamine-hydrolysing)